MDLSIFNGFFKLIDVIGDYISIITDFIEDRIHIFIWIFIFLGLVLFGIIYLLYNYHTIFGVVEINESINVTLVNISSNLSGG